MAGARGDALEWALALAAAPAERLALRQRPLPEGIAALLQVAGGGATTALADAVARTGRSPEALVEAARFYVREVLFHPDADAYRLLGVRRDADADTIKGHHRLLQQWLHPDRQTPGDDAVFAARVNAAWDQLRSKARRDAYDRALPMQVPAASADMPATVFAWRVQPGPDVDAASTRWRERVPLLALLGACVALGALAIVDQRRAPDPVLRVGVAEDAGEAIPGLALPIREADDPVLASASASPASVPPRRVTTPVHAARPSARPATTGSARVAASAVPARPPAPVVIADFQPTESMPARPVTAVRPPPSFRPTTMEAVAAVTTSVPAAVAEPSSPPPSASPVAVATAIAPTSPPPRVDAARTREAQRTGLRLLSYVQGRGRGVPPIWDTVAAQRAASRAREQLMAQGVARIEPAAWRVLDASGDLDASLRFSDGRAGVLRAALVWRDGQWLVRDLVVEPAG